MSRGDQKRFVIIGEFGEKDSFSEVLYGVFDTKTAAQLAIEANRLSGIGDRYYIFQLSANTWGAPDGPVQVIDRLGYQSRDKSA
jgi:hypothetical protein